MPRQNEFALIELIRRTVPSRATREMRIGIGDDAAVVRPRPGRELVISTDWFLEDAHFLADRHPAHAVGYKALARATSDLAAMGASPRYFFLTLALPAERTGKWLEQFARGMAAAARRFGMVLLGGDLAQNRIIAASLTVVGEARPGEAIARSGARPGDAIYVSGTLGAAALGLRLFLGGSALASKRVSSAALRSGPLQAHLYPKPRLALGQWLARRRLASAMIDLSDGFSTDLGHVCDASGAGARISAACLPTVRVAKAATRWKIDPVELALNGGEDYELLFTVPARRAAKLPKRFGSVRLTQVGEITRRREIVLIDAAGQQRPLVARGWDHFRPRSPKRVR